MDFPTPPPSIATSQPTCDDSADQLVAARAQRQSVILRNQSGGADAFVGASGVTTSTGIKIAQGEAITLDTTAAIFGVTASGTATFHVLETYR